MSDDDLERYLGLACLVSQKNGRINIIAFAEVASVEALWRLVDSDDVTLKYGSNHNYIFSLDPIYR